MNVLIKKLKLVSGGQTGADRAGLDFALANGVPCGGHCPRGRKAEDGPIPARYPLTETKSADYLKRTELNVKESDGTIIFTIAPTLTGGSKRTADFAAKYNKPWVHISGETHSPGQTLREFIERNKIRVLNIAGSRASKQPSVGEFVISVLNDVFGSK
jgi:hypothetical protein